MIGFPSARVGLDPGTANTLVYIKGHGVAVNEPSLVTIRTSNGGSGQRSGGGGRRAPPPTPHTPPPPPRA
ncbi:MAG: rod shape-determining protein [bacterium]